MMKRGLAFILTGVIFSSFCFYSQVNGQSADKIGALFEKLSWRCVGPAPMGGRTVDIDVVEKKPSIIYAAIGPSGVWKSENNGITWEPVFHKESTVSVGDVTVSQSHPDIVWVGTGEATCRNSVSIGDGAYKSTDGGKTWTNMGLKDTFHISRIIINPRDPNIVYVAAMGHLWGSNQERGIYKTVDGGKTWRKVLYINENTGFADLAIDPSDSLTLYAAAYEHRRLPYYFSSGGPGSGIYKTTDGGETWTKLTKDLPEGVMGRIGIDVSRSNPKVVYALIEHQDGGIWRSEDKGQSWKRTCDNKTFTQVNFRPFYYSQIRVDPSDDKVVYVFSGGCFRSQDMGAKFTAISAGIHPDHHALWIDPTNPLHLIDGNDGGIDISYDGGKIWYAVQNMTLAEVYQVGFDMRSPYYVYCGLQDNGVWGGPSATYDNTGINNDDWYMVGGGDGFFAQIDPTDPNTIYSNSQMNGLSRYDLRIKKGKYIRPQAPLKEPPYRFNWNSPIHISPHDPKTVYTGGNYLFKTADGGNSWEKISPDLSTNDPKKQIDSGGPITPDNTGAEIHCTIVTISESPVEKGVIWCGTDDGNVQITRDAGKTWKNMVKSITELPAFTWCSRIEASHFEAGTAYAAFDGHRHDDYNTYVFKTTDYGKTWKSVKGNLPFGWVNVIREDLKNKNLLFVGTELGIYASLDSGKTWFSLKNNLPTAAVDDIAVHPRENDLIIGTHGRGIWILDDISPLQEMTDGLLQSDFYLFRIRPTTQYYPATTRELYGRVYYAERNPVYGMNIYAYFKTKPAEKPKVVVKNEKGEEMFQVSLSTVEGLQRVAWNLQYLPKTKEGEEIKPSPMSFVSSPYARSGEYTVELISGEKKAVQKGTALPDPRFSPSDEDRAEQVSTTVEVMLLSKKMSLAITATRNVRQELSNFYKDTEKKEGIAEAVRTSVKDFDGRFSAMEKEIMPKGFGYRGSMEDALRGGSLQQLIMTVGSSISGFPSAPTQTELSQLKELTDALNTLVAELNALIKDEIPKLNKILEANGLKPLKAPEEVK